MYEFPILLCQTPQRWIDIALENQDLLLIDHAHCEKKAASTAMALLYRYPKEHKLLQRMSKIAREELRHFEQVLKIMQKRKIKYQHLSPSRYAKGLYTLARAHEPARLIDTMIIGAFVEARSCERFAALVPHLDDELAKFYSGLLASEARHYQHYIDFAQEFADEDISDRIKVFSEKERQLIENEDDEFRFHSGCPLE
jgi:tRNA 2-(methylsulfanyl)-N6-isopentenyladenosine37 hydroxylase